MVSFEGMDRRQDKIDICLQKYGFSGLEETQELCTRYGIDCNSSC